MNLFVIPGTQNLVNIVTSDPRNFKINSKGYIMRGAKAETPTSFFIIGVTQYSNLTEPERTRQICIAPPQEIWPRACAVIGGAFKQSRLFFQTFRQGLSFSTWAFTDKKGKQTSSSTKKGISSSSPISLSNHGLSALTVPVYLTVI
jgi:hypothetical protein